jgi:hypothetical protein
MTKWFREKKMDVASSFILRLTENNAIGIVQHLQVVEKAVCLISQQQFSVASEQEQEPQHVYS